MNGDGERKRHHAEKEARKILKKLRKSAEKSTEKQKVEAVTPVRRVYGPTRPPEPRPPERIAIGPEIPDFLKKRAAEEQEDEALDGTVAGPELPEDWMDEFSERDVQSSDAEVERILAVSNQKSTFFDPYQILGLNPESANDASVKKAYWKCLLAVHPDKSWHPQAPKAFQAAQKAYKEVSNEASRRNVEDKRKEADVKHQVEMEAKKEHRQREWDRVRHSNGGKSVAEEHGRQAWMTELPELRRKPQVMKQAHQTSFSRKEYADVTSGAAKSWTQSPEQRSRAPIGPSICPAMQPKRGEVTRMGVSLMEQHQVKMAQEQQKSSSTLKKQQQGTSSFQYRPFDRERDLERKGNAEHTFGSMMDGIGELRDRFR